MSNLPLVESSSNFTRKYLLSHLDSSFLYHNYDHSTEVAEVCELLANDADLPLKEREVLLLAAWFQDTGYAKDHKNLPESSIEIATDFLQRQNQPNEKIDAVAQLISSAFSEESDPNDHLAKILRDANYSYLGRKRFQRRSRLLLMERELVNKTSLTEHERSELLLNTLLDHKFSTEWGYNRYNEQKKTNILAQTEEVKKAEKITTQVQTGKNFGRGVDTLYRTTLRNHISLSRIADGKANMIISINTLVLSILITAGVAGFTSSTTMSSINIWELSPIIILMITSLTTIVLAVLSAIPKVSGISFTMEDVKDHRVSLLFFGNFLKIDKDQFVGHLRDLKWDQEVLYDDLSRDLYNLGAILRKKYLLLNIAYRIFIWGLILSFLAFVIFYLFL